MPLSAASLTPGRDFLRDVADELKPLGYLRQAESALTRAPLITTVDEARSWCGAHLTPTMVKALSSALRARVAS